MSVSLHNAHTEYAPELDNIPDGSSFAEPYAWLSMSPEGAVAKHVVQTAKSVSPEWKAADPGWQLRFDSSQASSSLTPLMFSTRSAVAFRTGVSGAQRSSSGGS